MHDNAFCNCQTCDHDVTSCSARVHVAIVCSAVNGMLDSVLCVNVHTPRKIVYTHRCCHSVICVYDFAGTIPASGNMQGFCVLCRRHPWDLMATAPRLLPPRSPYVVKTWTCWLPRSTHPRRHMGCPSVFHGLHRRGGSRLSDLSPTRW